MKVYEYMGLEETEIRECRKTILIFEAIIRLFIILCLSWLYLWAVLRGHKAIGDSRLSYSRSKRLFWYTLCSFHEPDLLSSQHNYYDSSYRSLQLLSVLPIANFLFFFSPI